MRSGLLSVGRQVMIMLRFDVVLFCVILLSLNIANQVLTACLQKLLHKSFLAMSHD